MITADLKRPVALMAGAPATIVAAAALSALTVTLGYVLLGAIPMLLFAFGFAGGLAAWLTVPSTAGWQRIKLPFLVALALFAVHKLEERQFGFFPALADLTGVPPPQPGGLLPALLYACAAAWLLVPWLVSRRDEFGYYLAWTFFLSMGFTELAHFLFPLFREGAYGYFPGMLSVIALAPAAWWGLWRLAEPGGADER